MYQCNRIEQRELQNLMDTLTWGGIFYLGAKDHQAGYGY